MKEVIYIEKEKKTKKHVEFTHCYDGSSGYIEALEQPSDYEKVIYLGNCRVDGDIFACYKEGYLEIYKGKLNSGYYE